MSVDSLLHRAQKAFRTRYPMWKAHAVQPCQLHSPMVAFVVLFACIYEKWEVEVAHGGRGLERSRDRPVGERQTGGGKKRSTQRAQVQVDRYLAFVVFVHRSMVRQAAA